MKPKLYKENTLYIGDSHLPFEHTNYLDFCYQIKQRVKCANVIHVGDLVDNHAISYHEHSPDGWSPEDEMKEVLKRLELWKSAFPVLKLCRGNHDCLVDRKGKTSGLPQRVFRPYREIWGFPDGWLDAFEWDFTLVKVIHGTRYSGKFAHVQAAYDARKSCIMGHTHSAGAVQYIDTSGQKIFGMNVGCGIDRNKYAFAYGKDLRFKPILGCGVTTDNGRYAQFFPM